MIKFYRRVVTSHVERAAIRKPLHDDVSATV